MRKNFPRTAIMVAPAEFGYHDWWRRPLRRLMERLGFLRDPGADFDHPLILNGHPFNQTSFIER